MALATAQTVLAIALTLQPKGGMPMILTPRSGG
jgi:hypothetical protein